MGWDLKCVIPDFVREPDLRELERHLADVEFELFIRLGVFGTKCFHDCKHARLYDLQT